MLLCVRNGDGAIFYNDDDDDDDDSDVFEKKNERENT